MHRVAISWFLILEEFSGSRPLTGSWRDRRRAAFDDEGNSYVFSDIYAIIVEQYDKLPPESVIIATCSSFVVDRCSPHEHPSVPDFRF